MPVITGKLADAVRGRDATTPAASWAAMLHAVRNLGRPGLVAESISAVDVALWDLYARLVELPLITVLGAVHEATPIYGSGGFTSYDDRMLADQLRGWVEVGIPRVKMKIGRDPGPPIPTGCGSPAKRSATTSSCSSTQGAKGDVTRCGGLSALVRVAPLCDARSLDLSLHCAPQVSAHAGTAVWHLRHLEYFHDHERIERLAFEGVLEPEPGGVLRADRARAGHGLELKDSDLEQYRAA